MSLTRRAHCATPARLTTIGAVLALLLSVSLALSSGAQAHMYWSTGASIARANLDGTSVDQNFITGSCGSNGLAVDAGHVYWANSNCTSIGRANLDGTGVNQDFITGLNFVGGYYGAHPGGLAVDATSIYWYIGVSLNSGLSGAGAIGKANLNGSGVIPQDLMASLVAPEGKGVAADGTAVYWTANYALSRYRLGSPLIDQMWITGLTLPKNVAVDRAHIYWTDWWQQSIGRANIDGSGANNAFITGAGGASGIAVGNGHIYWTTGTTIARANLDGTGVNLQYITGVNANAGLALDPPRTPNYMILGCDPQGVPEFASSKCVADVDDLADEGVPPTGTVTFHASAGTLSTSTCTLNQYTYCGVDWTPPADAVPGNWYSISAHYNGDATWLAGDFRYPTWVETVNVGGVGPQMPHLKEQCKDWWQLYTYRDGGQVFKTQGDCVSYVATQGKNGPNG